MADLIDVSISHYKQSQNWYLGCAQSVLNLTWRSLVVVLVRVSSVEAVWKLCLDVSITHLRYFSNFLRNKK